MGDLAKYNVFDILACRRIGKLERLFRSVPPPPGSELWGALPSWRYMAIDDKVPMVVTPDGNFTFTRGKLGQQIVHTSEVFDLDDPLMLRLKYEYDPIYDKHLGEYFKKGVNRARIEQLGLLAEGDRVICNLISFNAYRRYLGRLHREALHKKQYEMDRRDAERRMILASLKGIKLEVNKLLKYELVNSIKTAKGARMKGTNVKQLKFDEERRQQKERRTNNAEYRKEIKKVVIANEAKDLQDSILDHQKRAQEIERKRLAEIDKKARFAAWEREKAREQRTRENREKTKALAVEKWKEKTLAQERQIARERKIMKLYRKQMKLEQHRREKWYRAQRFAMDHKLQCIKSRNVIRKVHKKQADRRKRMTLMLLRELVPTYPEKSISKERIALIKRARRRAKSYDQYRFAHKIRWRISRKARTVKPALVGLDTLIRRLIYDFIRVTIFAKLPKIIIKINKVCKKLLNLGKTYARTMYIDVEETSELENRGQTTSETRLVLKQVVSKLREIKTSKTDIDKRVSFGKVEYIPLPDVNFSKHYKLPLRSVAGRIPTPMPSTTQLIAAALKDAPKTEKLSRRVVKMHTIKYRINHVIKTILNKLVKLTVKKVKKTRKNFYKKRRLSQDNNPRSILRRVSDALEFAEELTFMIYYTPFKFINSYTLDPYAEVLFKHATEPHVFPLPFPAIRKFWDFINKNQPPLMSPWKRKPNSPWAANNSRKF